ncbi:hypothetical protein CAEBREN_12844 [Caenorhabditis brenneri]|uniref:CXXC-type zinc finger protein 1 n=1 Tax=Caenorhabditis brenneri TaxID=135651 RepID=G0P9M5_CAEBE|nr:hypothetical protein CAEBREN_12844 [Caenorhabditis brenneri]
MTDEEELKKQTDANLRAIMAKTAQREAQLASTSTSHEKVEPQEKKKRGRKKKEVVEREQRERMQKQQNRQITEDDYVPNRPTRQQSADLRRKKAHKPEQEVYHEPVQCLNPDCIYEAEPYSKYCSRECGMMLARLRLVEHLPKRVAEHFGDGPAGPRTLEAEIIEKQVKVREEFKQTTEKESVLIAFLQKLDTFVANQVDLKPLGTEERLDDTVSYACLICANNDIPLSKYVKHIELCWARSERAMSFGAPEKNNDKIYCEYKEEKTGSYCKRLKSLCPEHRKPGVEQHLMVCGYPKKWIDMFGTSTYTGTFSELIALEDPFGDEGCRTLKEVCSMHLKWIPSIRGCIELEQAGLFQRLFDLVTENSRLQDRLEWNSNALSIMIHPNKSEVVDKEAFANFVRRMQNLSVSAPPPPDGERSFSSEASSSSSREKTDDDMNDVGLFLAELAVQKEQQAALERLNQQQDGGGGQGCARTRPPPPPSTPSTSVTHSSTNSFHMLSISSTSDAPPPPLQTPPDPPLISPPRPSSNFSVDRFLK